MGASKAVIQRSIDAAALIFTTVGYGLGLTICGALEADITLWEGHTLEAQAQFEQCLKSSFGYHPAILTYCLAQLGDMTRWGAGLNWMPSWPTVLLAHSLRSKQKLGIYKGLQFIGDIALAQDDEDTAIALFTVALEGFTEMDVHRGKAECTLRLGDICKQHKNYHEAVEYWNTARPLFERSSQVKQVENIDKRLACISEGKHRPINSFGKLHSSTDIEDVLCWKVANSMTLQPSNRN
jgi:tetratricopeptide (TPR) repeat protein